MDKNNILLLVNPEKDKNLIFTKAVISFLKEHNCTVFLEEEINSLLNELLITVDTKISFALVIGGDGTLLNKLHLFNERYYQYFGINLGRVGCLMEADKTNYQNKIIEILKGNYHLENRNALSYKITCDNKTYSGTAFNEIAIERGSRIKMLNINMHINGKNKTTFYADGVVIATSTGSSAYSLSCGGPLLMPEARNFVITPICPQLRSITSLVVNDTDIIDINFCETHKLESVEQLPQVVIDGKKAIEIDEKSSINITKSINNIKILKVDDNMSLFEATQKVSKSYQELLK